jgi:hypothetical protein
MGSPSIFVYDCSNAGLIVKSFKQFALQREQELEVRPQEGCVVSCFPREGGGWDDGYLIDKIPKVLWLRWTIG